jgi:hypothetical protein
MLEDYWWCTKQVVTLRGGMGRELVGDDGGDVMVLIPEGVELESGSDWVNLPQRAAFHRPAQAQALDRNRGLFLSAGVPFEFSWGPRPGGQGFDI